jgi:tetratricopeptide (TPR) repeat protein
MIQMVQKYLDIVEKVNKPRDPTDPPSVFLMDAILQVVSLQCQIDDRDVTEEIDANIERIENICGQHGLINGCQLSHSA